MLDKYDRSSDAGRQGVYFSRIFDVVWIMDVIANISDFNIIVFSVFFYVDRLEPQEKKTSNAFFPRSEPPWAVQRGILYPYFTIPIFFWLNPGFLPLKNVISCWLNPRSWWTAYISLHFWLPIFVDISHLSIAGFPIDCIKLYHL